MLELLWLIPALPFTGAVFLTFANPRMNPGWAAVAGVTSIGLSALLAIAIAVSFISSPPPGNAFTQTLWTWISSGWFRPEVAFRLDPLSLVMVLVVTIVGFLIHLYSAEYMSGDEGYRRFFLYMNIFVGSMLTLVLADNLLLLYFGWEGVGVASYLLIGFWYGVPYNGYAARKAFIITRAGDTAFIIGIILLATTLGTLDIQEVMSRASAHWAGRGLAVIAASLLLAGALGKSAQLPLQTWLPDAMAGPTPVSALLHAATMVTAGVYLIARTHVLFELAPPVMGLVAAIGAATLIISAFSALVQTDIKRVLAYSTISQIGYMFLALGVGAWPAAIFHFMTHAFFKALLFLGAGAIIVAFKHERDIFSMGGARSAMPLAFWTFLAGAASLSAIPFATAGFYSKDLILSGAWSSGGYILWVAGTTGAFLTALYAFRVVFIVFFGERKAALARNPGMMISIPLVILALFSLAAGFVETPAFLGGVSLFTGFLQPVFSGPTRDAEDLLPLFITALVPVAGVLAAYFIYLKRSALAGRLAGSPVAQALRRLWLGGWGFDRLYDVLFVRPFLWLADKGRADILDLPFAAIAHLSVVINRALAITQSGRLRSYAAGLTIGAVLALFAVFLS